MTAPPVRRRLTLTQSLFIAHVLLLTVALGVTGALWVVHNDREVDRQYTERVLAIARSVAVQPEIRAAFELADPASVVAPRADAVTEATGAQFIVVADRSGIRYSHPNRALIGEVVSTPPGRVLRGEDWTGFQIGTEGRSVRAKVPVRDDAGAVVGYVSVGILASDLDTAAATALPMIVGTVVGALLLGAGGAYLLSRRLRAKTHGLEPAEITALLEGREALLYGIREGVLALDHAGRVTLVNRPAREMLELPADCEGRHLDELRLDSRLHDVLCGTDPGADRIVLVGARVLVCNRKPVRLHGQDAGAVVTLRDRTELERLTGELDGARTLTRGLRAQSHEFANRIHTVAGMLELGAHEDARAFLDELSAAHTRTSADVAARIADPAVAALVLAKSAQAAERGAELRLSPTTGLDGRLPADLREDVLLVLGNLVDNALDSVAGSSRSGCGAGKDPSGCGAGSSPSGCGAGKDPSGCGAGKDPGGWVELLLCRHGRAEDGLPHDLIEIRVVDSGPGVDPALTEEVFTLGFTTKVARSGGQRGLGLALVRQTCESRGGTVSIDSPAGSAGCVDGAEYSVFTAYLPVTGATAGAR
ncbi:ATP-binding protein [Marinitenerispora sediminis]|uniref:histidine kinase n=1 Tax=Marinitenerispora sediminis TaxID=1931232 RepID=A0A368T298_9ACTN|nr:sensor histidine kinase [Marinitenerispora sediminis]RCV49785.1 histidine kinase [Marinitenerispora sediminis]RCV50200.1 histidine kinase [Marinitenerispora sediminis]RCV55207.1 histidine kinase [Marinitenerispora sediminis]